LLPRWRGAAPIHRALLAGDSATGVSIMCMNEGLDTGPVLSTHQTLIGARETETTLRNRLAMLGAQVLVAALADYASGKIAQQAQTAMGVTYAHKIRKEEALLDWQQPAANLDAQIRAFNSWPIAETRWRGQQLRVWEAMPISIDTSVAPGTVVNADANGIVVATGAGALNLLRVQLAGRKQMSASEFLNAHRIVGDVLGGSVGVTS
jgi:methionyl-tRNA formyltransferase